MGDDPTSEGGARLTFTVKVIEEARADQGVFVYYVGPVRRMPKPP